MSTRCATERSGPCLGSSLATVQPAVTHVWLSMWGVRMALVLTEFLPKPSGRWGLRRSVSSPGLRGREGHRMDSPTGALTRSALPSSLGKECPRRDPLPPKVHHWPEQVSWPHLALQGWEGPRCALALGRRGEAASVAWGRRPRMRLDVHVPPVTPFPLPLATRGSNTRDCRITCYVTAISPDPASKVHRPLRPTRWSLWAGVRLFARPLGRPFPRTPLRSAPRGLLGQHVTVTQYVLGVVIFNSFLIYLKS